MKIFGNSKHGKYRSNAAGKAAPDQSAARSALPDQSAAAPEQAAAVPDQPPKAKKGKLRNSKIGKKWMSLPGTSRGLILLALSILLFAGTCFAGYTALVKPPETTGAAIGTTNKTTTKKVTQIDPLTGEEVEIDLEIPLSHKENYYNILITGTDNDGGRTDTIIVARLDATAHTVALMSVPRDTLISANYSVPKINSAYAAGGMGVDGMKNLQHYVEQTVGFELDGFLLVDLTAFKKIIDLMEGVDFNVPQRMYYTDPTQNLYIDLYPGMQHLDGEHAMQLVRYRSYAEADIQRTRVQQNFIQALAKKCLSISNLTKIQEFADIIAEYVTTDLTVGNMVYFGQELLQCDFDSMKSYTLEGDGIMIRGGSYYQLSASKVLAVVNESFNPYDEDLTLSDLHITTHSSSGSASYSGSSGASSTTSTADTTAKPTEEPPDEIPAEGTGDAQPPSTTPTDTTPTEPADPNAANDTPPSWLDTDDSGTQEPSGGDAAQTPPDAAQGDAETPPDAPPPDTTTDATAPTADPSET
ncbi:MAG: LCP family protein [Oscillospiraceae bacterium]|nr:LCP family protein [Oscillospiraceae bacterium]